MAQELLLRNKTTCDKRKRTFMEGEDKQYAKKRFTSATIEYLIYENIWSIPPVLVPAYYRTFDNMNFLDIAIVCRHTRILHKRMSTAEGFTADSNHRNF